MAAAMYSEGAYLAQLGLPAQDATHFCDRIKKALSAAAIIGSTI